MRLPLAILAAYAIPLATLAQSPSDITAAPLPPLPPAEEVGPELPPQPHAPADKTSPTAPSAPGDAAAAAQPLQQTWLAQGAAKLQVLDKINAQNTVLTVKVGQQAQYGSLTIQVQACDIRPPDQPQNSAAYLAITDSHTDAPGFKGWMLANQPWLSMLQNPIYDVRVVGCRA